jgi:Phosphotransferase enzyme family
MTRAEDDLYLDQCMNLLASITVPKDGPVEVISISRPQGGLFNYLLRVETTKGVFFFKKYLDSTTTPLFSPPEIPASDRASLAVMVQKIAARTMSTEDHLVPDILAFDTTANAFLMEAAPAPQPLITYLSQGSVPNVIPNKLAPALAHLHSGTTSTYEHLSPLHNTEFRNFKLGLQYHDMAYMLGGTAGALIEEFVADYKHKQQCMTHGDLNSRNILLCTEDFNSVMVIDFEQAHLGTPAFDLGYLLSELFIAAYHFESIGLMAAIRQFLDSYFEVFGENKRTTVEVEATMHTAAQMLYRFRGPSNASWTFYVDEDSRNRILNAVVQMISDRPQPLTDFTTP